MRVCLRASKPVSNHGRFSGRWGLAGARGYPPQGHRAQGVDGVAFPTGPRATGWGVRVLPYAGAAGPWWHEGTHACGHAGARVRGDQGHVCHCAGRYGVQEGLAWHGGTPGGPGTCGAVRATPSGWGVPAMRAREGRASEPGVSRAGGCEMCHTLRACLLMPWRAMMEPRRKDRQREGSES